MSGSLGRRVGSIADEPSKVRRDLFGDVVAGIMVPRWDARAVGDASKPWADGRNRDDVQGFGKKILGPEVADLPQPIGAGRGRTRWSDRYWFEQRSLGLNSFPGAAELENESTSRGARGPVIPPSHGLVEIGAESRWAQSVRDLLEKLARVERAWSAEWSASGALPSGSA